MVQGGNRSFTFGSEITRFSHADMAWVFPADVLHSLGSGLKGQTKVMKSSSVKDLGKSRVPIYSKELPFISLGKHGNGEQQSEKEREWELRESSVQWSQGKNLWSGRAMNV